MLVGVRGSHALNDKLILSALNFTPALFIDCAGCSDIHRFSQFPIEKFMRLNIVPAESLYRFLPTIKKIPELAEKTGTDTVVISSFTNLFNYDDQEEVRDVFSYAWELLGELGEDYNIYAGIEKGSLHESLTDCKKIDVDNMGHTINSQRIETDVLMSELKQFSKALGEEDRKIFNRLINKPLKHLGSISYTSSVNVWVFFLLAVMIEQEKKNVAPGRVQEKE